MSLYTDIAWGRRTTLSQEELNKRAKIVADAIEALRAFVPDWEAQVAALSAVGLERINEALLPAYQQIIEVSSLGALFSATSASSVEIGSGTKTFVVADSQRLNFAPTPYLMVYAEGSYANSMVGVLSSYDNETGVLIMEVADVNGTGTFDDWDIGPIATTDDLEALRDAVEAAQADVAAKKAVVDTKHADVVAIGSLYYGARDTAPVGAALGSQYLDTSTTPNVVKVLTSTGWAPTVTVSVGGRRTQDYVAAEDGVTGPFAVDGGFSTGDVYVNGVLMRVGVDVTLTPGETGSFTFAEGLVEGDLVSFRGFLANDVTDIYTKSEVDGSRVRFDAAQPLSLAQRGQARANIGGGVLAGFRNKIINGRAEIAQRGTGFNIPAGQAAYTSDRIRIFNSTNQTLNVQCPVVIPFAGSGKHPRLRLSFATAPTSGNVFVTQRIEGADTLANGKATMSFAHAAGEVVAASCYLSQNFGSGGSAAVGVPAQNVDLRNDGGIGIAKLVFDLPSTESKIFGANDFLEWAVSIPVRSTNPLTITRMSLVEGDATAEDDPFAARDPGQERRLCERFLEIVSGGYSGPVTTGNGYWGFAYPRVQKRATPSVSWYRGQAVFRFPNSAPVIENVTPDGAIAFRMAATATGDGAYAIHSFFLDSEL